jgi:hypothetical protein
MQSFNITKINKQRYQVKTQYNSFLILIDEVKGIGIYLEYEGGNQLIKQYYHQNLETAINYLFRENIF